MNSFRFAALYLLIVVSTSNASKFFDVDENIALDRIRRYTKRQADGNCMYNMCNQTEGYPAEEIKTLVEKNEAFKKLFGTVVQPYNFPIESRIGEGEENMCESQLVYMVPQKARDINLEWHTIVNVEEYHQVVEFETCTKDEKCFAADHIPDEITFCGQINIVVKMIAFDNMNGFVSKDFPVPSGCVCKYLKD